jgi:ATP-binding cassette subfamily B protein/subfamily B ATP-binding cassette protein MsbA
MPFRPPTSRQRYTQYKADLKAHETEGSRTSAAAHAKIRQELHRHHQRSFLDLIRAFFGLLHGQRRFLAVAMTTVTVATGLSLFPPYASKIIFDNVLGDRPLPVRLAELGLPADPRSLLSVIAVAVIGVVIAAAVVGLTGRWLATRATKRVQSKVRKRVFEHAVRLPLHRVWQLKSGGVASILREDAGGVAELIFSMIYNPWRAIVRLIGSLIILAITDWRLLLGAVLLLPTIFFTHRTWISRIRPMWRDIRHSRQMIDGQATEAFGGMRVVRAFGRQRSETARFIRSNHLMIRQELLAWWWSRGIDTAWSILIPAASAALLWYGGMRVISGALTTGELVMFLMYLMWLLEPLATLAGSATAFQNSLAGLDRVLDLLEEPREMAECPGSLLIDPSRVAGRVTLKDVTFTYPGSERSVLADIALDVAPGQVVALVGPSGAGKTTLCNLIARFYDPDRGVIELDGTDLREIDLESYRQLLGIVEQDIFLFDGTIAENIGYARRDATLEDIRRVARLANADGFIEELEESYGTIIGERGVRLSGGQRQRIAIARALLADPRILILDEATSNLDTESETLIQDSLRTLMRDRTSFVIAHRLSTIADADLIVVLEDGGVVEQGTHDELMRRSGRYQQMVRLQLQSMRDPLASRGEAAAPASGGSHEVLQPVPRSDEG